MKKLLVNSLNKILLQLGLNKKINEEKLFEFVRFVFVGVLSTALHYGIYYLLFNFLNTTISYSIGYIVSFVMNFYLTSYFTFNEKPSWDKILGMAGAHGINYLLHISLLNLFLFVGLSKTLAPLPVFLIVIPINFILVRFVFKYRKRKEMKNEEKI